MTGRIRTHLAWMAIAALVVVASACSSGTQPGPTGAPPTQPPTSVQPVEPSEGAPGEPSAVAQTGVCSLLSLEEAEAAFGQTFNPPVGEEGEPSECRYFNSAGFGLQLEVSRAPTIEADYAAAKAGFGDRAADLPGVGDEAFEYFQGRRQVVFLQGDALVTLYSASRVEPEVFRALARTVADRL